MVTNDGRQDRMIMATQLLLQRISEIKQIRAANGMDPTPTLMDIEKTHLIFQNAYFKPFAAMGFEYFKVTPTGAVTLGQKIQFSIPQYGDFFGDAVVYMKIAPAATVLSAGSYSDLGTAGVTQNLPAVRWASFPGERLLKTVKFEVNSNPLDEYTKEAYNFYRQLNVTEDKKQAYYRLVGQELPQEGWLTQPDGTANGVAPTSSRMAVSTLAGYQTPKQAQTDLEVMVPLLLWFCTDPRLQVPSVAIPYGQRFISIELATAQELYGFVPRGTSSYGTPNANATLTASSFVVSSCELYINNVFINSEVHDIYIRRIGFSLIRVHRLQTASLTAASGSQLMSDIKWPVEFLQYGVKISSYDTVSSNFSSENIDKWQNFSQTTNTSRDLTLMSNQMSVVPAVTVTAAAADGVFTVSAGLASAVVSLGDWISIAAIAAIPAPAAATPNASFVAQVTNISGAATFTVSPPNTIIMATASQFRVWKRATATIPVTVTNVDTVKVKAHGITVYDIFRQQFYNSYLPFQYGGSNLVSPTDPGVGFITFCLYPGTYQPSGHYNFSRAREFYFEYASSTISSNVPGTLYILASAINFLLIADGSALLRYTT